MASTLERADLPALALGYSLLGSGGGGSTTMLELVLREPSHWPIELARIDEIDPDVQCLGAAFVGSTMLLGERLPGRAPFAPLIEAVERWLGRPIGAVCSLEGGGLNGLTPLTLAGERRLVDADLTGRAVPGLDQMSLLVDGVPGVVAASDSGAGGVVLVQAGRAEDLERVIRSAVIQAGGVGGAVFAGFTVGDLAEHAVHGGTARALELGRSFERSATSPLPELAARLGARVLGGGRITAVDADARDPHVNAVEIAGDDGAVHRAITRSETLAFVSDGVVRAAAPEIIVALDRVTRDILEVTELVLARTVDILALPAPGWWTERPERLRRVAPSAYGLAELDGAA